MCRSCAFSPWQPVQRHRQRMYSTSKRGLCAQRLIDVFFSFPRSVPLNSAVKNITLYPIYDSRVGRLSSPTPPTTNSEVFASRITACSPGKKGLKHKLKRVFTPAYGCRFIFANRMVLADGLWLQKFNRESGRKPFLQEILKHLWTQEGPWDGCPPPPFLKAWTYSRKLKRWRFEASHPIYICWHRATEPWTH